MTTGTEIAHGEFARNEILRALPGADLARLLEHAESQALSAGHTLKSPGESYSSVFFPTSGVVAGVAVLRDGHNVEIATVGTEGVIGVGPILGLQEVAIWFVAPISTTVYAVPVDVFVRRFAESEPLRQLTLAHLGQLFVEIARSAACNRFHSHRARLARWLVITTRKAETHSLEFTHDFIAQMVGGPRHAVSVALEELQATAAIKQERGRVVVVDAARLAEAACECASTAHLSR